MYSIAIVGATGAVGREIIDLLAERKFPIKKLHALASENSSGEKLSFGSTKVIIVESLNNHDFTSTDIAFFCLPEIELIKDYIEKATKAGCIVIDNSALFRLDPEIPLIIPEVNKQAITTYSKHNIIANPNCGVIQMLVALKPLYDLCAIRKIYLSTYQSVSGAGRAAMDELYNQTKDKYVFKKITPKVFKKQISFNCLPQIGELLEDGNTTEEEKIIKETQKILDPKIQLAVTCVRVPVFVGHAHSLTVELSEDITLEQAIETYKKAKGIVLKLDDYITQLEVVEKDEVYLCRLRKLSNFSNTFSLWVVADNLRKGAALNAVQIAETLIETYI